MSKFGSPKRAFMLSLGLILYIILVALLMFYIEECSIDEKDPPRASDLDPDMFRDQCKLILATFTGNSTINETELNISLDGCKKLVQSLMTRRDMKSPTCRFNVINYFPWVHCVAFSLMTIGKLYDSHFLL